MSSAQAATGRVYGHIPGYPVYSTFKTKEELWRAGVHVQRQAGIHGDTSENGGAFSICLSEGYEDNKDNGDTIIYVGSGGQDRDGVQVADQSFDHLPNRALQLSYETKRPVRVVRGKNETSFYSPPEGYRYDGLYVVDEAYMNRGKKGYQMCTFKLRRIHEEGVGSIPTRRLLTSKKLQKIAKRK